jgi:hypothetical protein
VNLPALRDGTRFPGTTMRKISSALVSVSVTPRTTIFGIPFTIRLVIGTVTSNKPLTVRSAVRTLPFVVLFAIRFPVGAPSI